MSSEQDQSVFCGAVIKFGLLIMIIFAIGIGRVVLACIFLIFFIHLFFISLLFSVAFIL